MPRTSTKTLIAKLEKQLYALKQREAASELGVQKRALAKIVKLARSVNLDVETVAAALGKSTSQRRDSKKSKPEVKNRRSKVAPKYRNPADPTQVWTGRGKPPIWAAPLKAAGTLDTARIQP